MKYFIIKEVTVVKLKLDINNVDDRRELHNKNSAYYKQILKHLEKEVITKFMSSYSLVGYRLHICVHVGKYNSFINICSL